jgi:Bacterial lectin/PKD domain/CHU_C Type IX secretion signal domain
LPSGSGLIKRLLTLSVLLLAGTFAFSQNYVFAQLTGAPMNTKGWNLTGDAQVANVIDSNYDELRLCPAVDNSNGAAFFNQPINLSFCSKWIAEFDFRMYDGTGADGLAFCFLDVPPTGFVNGGGLGIPASANGLKVCFDTWNNCIPFDPSTVHQDMPKIEIRWGLGYSNNFNPNAPVEGECVNEPTRDNSDGRISYIRSPNYNHAKITYDSGQIKVYVNDTLYLTAQHQFDFTGYLGFTASTGGYDDNHSIKNVIIYTQMPPSYAGTSVSFCPQDIISLGGPSNPSYRYAWYPATGLNDTALASPLLHLSNDADTSQSFTYYVKTSYVDNTGCASLDSVTVKLYPNPNVNFITPEICLTDAIAKFRDSSYTGESDMFPFTYEWNFGDPNAQPPGNPNYSNLQNPSHAYSAASNYVVGLSVTNSKGCTDSARKIFTVNGAVPKAMFTVHDTADLCSNNAVQITNNSTVDFGSIVRVQIFWGDSAGISYTDSTPYPGKTYSHYYPNPVTSSVNSYTIRMISSSGTLCQNETDETIYIKPGPHLQFDSIPTVCNYDAPFNITQATELTGIPGSFIFAGSGVSSTGLLNPQMAGDGLHKILCVYNATNGCVDSAYQTVLIQAPPVVNPGNDTSIVINEPLQLHAVSSDASGDTFAWSPSTGLNNPVIPDPVAILEAGTDSVRYFVTVTDAEGCHTTASLEVKVFQTMPDIFVPNAFTPGANINTIFRPIPVGITELQFFRVYSRWGQLVYSTSRIGEGWDGTIAGIPQTTGTYVWMVQGTTYTGKTIFKKGAVTLIR